MRYLVFEAVDQECVLKDLTREMGPLRTVGRKASWEPETAALPFTVLSSPLLPAWGAQARNQREF